MSEVQLIYITTYSATYTSYLLNKEYQINKKHKFMRLTINILNEELVLPEM